ncbi:glycosyltransferase family 4 protein [Almyronema epifaneia]|uniref:Glycosyltransferase family 4 protein n=1 Tax=Almyronema epifaneia S1 TaxID=2991925 RepID=A0ABW6IBB3_9CYAN
MTGFKILVSAYACRPQEGSEPGIGWHLVQELAKVHQVWVLTRANNQPAIAAELAANPISNLQVIYCDLPLWLQKLNHGQKLVHLHYYLWQIAAYRLGRRLQAKNNFDLVHHVTYVRYWSPSFLSLLPLPFVWGPVGGGEATPRGFWSALGKRGLAYELLREAIHRLSELDPFLRLTARRSAIAYATTADTARCLRRLGAQRVEVFSQLGLSTAELSALADLPLPPQPRFLSMGRLLHWKGFHLGLQAFAQADLPPDVTYWIVGDGPERDRLKQLAAALGISDRVKFWGKLSRSETLQKLADCSVLVHPSLHDSGALVCAEAMAAGRPVICLDQGGPALQVTAATGFKVAAQQPAQVIQDLAAAMDCLAQDKTLWQQMSQASRQRIQSVFSWASKGQQFTQLYQQLVKDSQPLASVALEPDAGNALTQETPPLATANPTDLPPTAAAELPTARPSLSPNSNHDEVSA